MQPEPGPGAQICVRGLKDYTAIEPGLLAAGVHEEYSARKATNGAAGHAKRKTAANEEKEDKGLYFKRTGN